MVGCGQWRLVGLREHRVDVVVGHLVARARELSRVCVDPCRRGAVPALDLERGRRKPRVGKGVGLHGVVAVGRGVRHDVGLSTRDRDRRREAGRLPAGARLAAEGDRRQPLATRRPERADVGARVAGALVEADPADEAVGRRREPQPELDAPSRRQPRVVAGTVAPKTLHGQLTANDRVTRRADVGAVVHRPHLDRRRARAVLDVGVAPRRRPGRRMPARRRRRSRPRRRPPRRRRCPRPCRRRVTFEPFAWVEPAAGELIVTVGRVVSVDLVAATRPDISVVGCAPMSASRLTCACCIRGSAGSGSNGVSCTASRPHVHWMVPAEKTSAPLGALYIVRWWVVVPGTTVLPKSVRYWEVSPMVVLQPDQAAGAREPLSTSSLDS